MSETGHHPPNPDDRSEPAGLARIRHPIDPLRGGPAGVAAPRY